jgi:hypothetical protein
MPPRGFTFRVLGPPDAHVDDELNRDALLLGPLESSIVEAAREVRIVQQDATEACHVEEATRHAAPDPKR